MGDPEQISLGVRQALQMLARRQDRIGFLDHVLDIGGVETAATQPGAKASLIRQNVAVEPTGPLKTDLFGQALSGRKLHL